MQPQREGPPIPHATATTQGHGEAGRTIEWWGTDVGGDRTTAEPVAEGQGPAKAIKPANSMKLR